MNYEYEKKFLDDYMNSLKFFKPNIFKIMYRTGLLSSQIGKTLEIDDKEFFLAGFYANIGLLGFEKFIEKEFLNEKEYKQIKRHPALSSQFLESKNLYKASEYVYYHHELPDGSGYYGYDNYPVESDYIRIADTFNGAITPKSYRPPLTLKEALELSLSPYKNGLKINIDDIKKIENILIRFYNDMLQMF